MSADKENATFREALKTFREYYLSSRKIDHNAAERFYDCLTILGSRHTAAIPDAWERHFRAADFYTQEAERLLSQLGTDATKAEVIAELNRRN
jgi:hypothetical protein